MIVGLTLQQNSTIIKSVFLRTYLGKSQHPKIHKNCPIEMNEINGAVFVNFWVMRFSQVSKFLNKIDFTFIITIDAKIKTTASGVWLEV